MTQTSIVFLSTSSPQYESPKRHRDHCEAAARCQENASVIDGYMVRVDDVDAHHARPAEAGARVLRAPEDVAAAVIRLSSGEDVEGHR